MTLAHDAVKDPVNRLAGARDCSRPVDLVHLAKYTLGNRGLEREVLELFRSHSTGYLDRLCDAVSDPKKWREAAHTIKGSALGIGAWKLAAAAEEAERSDHLAVEACQGLIDRVRQRTIEANNYIEQLFAGA